MSDIIYTTYKEKNGNRKLKIYREEYPEDPREQDNLGKMICFHKHYNLGDKHDIKSNSFSSWLDIEDYLRKELSAVIILPLYLYDHSGITISTSRNHLYNDYWDSGQVGFIYVDKETIKREKLKREEAIEILEDEVNVYDHYITGEVYSFRLVEETYDRYYNCVLEKVIDECSGFYGSDFYKNGIFDSAGINIDDFEEE